MLIEVLHGEYSDTRQLAVVQLVLIGEKAIPPLISFLKKEDKMEKDLNALGGLEMDNYHRARSEFKIKWGKEPDNLSISGIQASTKMHNARSRSIEGALQALTLLEVPNLNVLFPELALVRKFYGTDPIAKFFT